MRIQRTGKSTIFDKIVDAKVSHDEKNEQSDCRVIQENNRIIHKYSRYERRAYVVSITTL